MCFRFFDLDANGQPVREVTPEWKKYWVRERMAVRDFLVKYTIRSCMLFDGGCVGKRRLLDMKVPHSHIVCTGSPVVVFVDLPL